MRPGNYLSDLTHRLVGLDSENWAHIVSNGCPCGPALLCAKPSQLAVDDVRATPTRHRKWTQGRETGPQDPYIQSKFELEMRKGGEHAACPPASAPHESDP
jgi:hypothetical protein